MNLPEETTADLQQIRGLVKERNELHAALSKAVEILESEPEIYGIYKAHHAMFTELLTR